MNPRIDVQQLAIQRETAAAPRPAPRDRQRVLIRYVLPGTVLAGFVVVLAWTARASLLPAHPVTVVPVLTSRGESAPAGAPMFQAAGWVEPRPTPVLVTALAEGVVEQLLVVEGQEVRAGEPVARLIDVDAKLTVNTAEAELQLRQAELASAEAGEKAAKTTLAEPVQLQALSAEAEASLAQKETEAAALPAQMQAAVAREQVARQDYAGKEKSSGSLAPITVERSRADWQAAAAVVDELKAKQAHIGKEVEALTKKREALKRRLELKTDEQRQFSDAQAMRQAAKARLTLAEIALETAKLRLERMTVRSPFAGRVLALAARPGARVMGLSPGAIFDASTVVTMYDPKRLQIRADVRLDDVPSIQPGMPCRIETPAVAGGVVHGEVLFSTSQADIQKNTLQVKVSILDPPTTLRPDMLVQVTFLAPAPKASEHGSPTLRVLVYRQFVETAEGVARVWIADQAAGVARLRTVQVRPAAGEFVEIISGLNATDRVISGGRERLRDGQRIRISGEDTGRMASGPAPAKSSNLQRLPTGDMNAPKP